jgi:exodeoxyribonuclease III
MKIISYNVNGIRAAIRKGLFNWIAEAKPDIICFQEVKALKEEVDTAHIEALGYQYHNWVAAEKKGYSGVATFSRIAPTTVVEGCGIPHIDSEGRILRTDYGDWTLLNCYFPSGTSGEERQEFKFRFLDEFYDWVMELKRTRPNLVILGDYNIAHQDIDIHSPKTNQKTSGFLPEERAWMTKWLSDGGFIDAFRTARPDFQQYSWWSTRFNSRANNKGWRIDYQCASGTMAAALKDAVQLNDVVHSDHCPVEAVYDL